MTESRKENLQVEDPSLKDLFSNELLFKIKFKQDLQLSAHDEYFLALGKRKEGKDSQHSFLMLGVVHQGTPILLTCVGKAPILYESSNVSFDINWVYEVFLGNGIPARIQYEGIGRVMQSKPISYQAYSITLNHQLVKFFHLLQDIEKEQLNDDLLYDIEQYQLKGERKKERIFRRKNPRIQCYAPLKRCEDQLTFRWEDLQAQHFNDTLENDVNPIKNDAQRIQALNNNCRKTMVDMLDAILGVPTNVSKNCPVALAYETIWAPPGQLDKQTFYILPPPPPTTSEKLTKDQLKTLKKLYARLEEIPKLNPGSKETREKFNALKEMYNGIAGEENLDVPMLLARIQEHENKNKTALYKNRGFFFFKTTTQGMMEDIKSNLEYKSNRACKSS